MRMSQLFNRTLRQEPSEADTASHRLLLKAGLVQQVAAGVYAYLPLAWRTLRKIEHIIREEMDAAGGQELFMPNLNPRELWEESGRWDSFGPELIKLKDRKGRDFCLAPTHEEVVTDLVRHRVQSYRDLPLILYQIQVKMRDEPRPRGRAGARARVHHEGRLLLRQRPGGPGPQLPRHGAGLQEHLLPLRPAGHRRGGRQRRHRRQGQPRVHAARRDRRERDHLVPRLRLRRQPGARRLPQAARSRAAPSRLLPMEEVATPGIKTIAQLANFLGIPASDTAKAVFYTAIYADREELVFAVIRGDYEINEVKLRNYLKCAALELASDAAVARAGLVAGSASPVGLQGVRVVVDDSVAESTEPGGRRQQGRMSTCAT